MGVVARVTAAFIEKQRHRLDELHAQGFRQRFDQRGETSADDDNRPAVLAQGLQGFSNAADDGFDVLERHGFTEGFVGSDDFHAARENLVERDVPVHRRVGEVDHLLKNFRSAGAGEFVDAFDRGEGGVAVEKNQLAALSLRGLNRHQCVERGEIEEFDDIDVRHADAAVAGGGADQLFLIGAMDVDAARQRVLVFGVEAVEPEDARGDQVVFHHIVCRPQTRGFACFENRSQGLVVADFFTNAELTGRGAVTFLAKAHALGRGGNRVFAENLVTFRQPQQLFIDGDADVHKQEVI